MKKLLVLALVLGISSVATAGTIDLQISSWGPASEMPDTTPLMDPVSEITLLPSEWINMDIIYTADVPWGLASLALDIIVTGNASLDVSDLTEPPGAWDSGMHWITINSPQSVTIDFGMSAGVLGTGMPEIALDHILLHCDDYDDPEGPPTTVTLVANYGTNMQVTAEMNWDTAASQEVIYGPGVTVHQIPEPMTLALLGLGGLFLVRRKK